MIESAIADIPQGETFSGVGKCIYCLSGTDGRTREHIVPYFLNGYHYMNDASCSSCQEITKKFEDRLANLTYPAMRSLYKFRSRSKNYKETIPIKIERASNICVTVEEDIDQAPIPIIVPFFPALPFNTAIPDDWPTLTTLKAVHLPDDSQFNEKFGRFFKKHGGIKAHVIAEPIKVADFARLIYKISIGFMWIVSPEIAEKSSVRKLTIMDNFPNFPKFENLYSAPSDRKPMRYYRIRVFTESVGTERRLFVGVRIFLAAHFPEYFCDFGPYAGDHIEQIFIK